MFAWFVLLLLGAIWGSSYLFIKVAVADIPPFTLVAVRTFVAALALLAVLRFKNESLPRTRQGLLPLLALGVFNGVIPYTLITWGEVHISSGLAAILTAAMPLFTILIAHFWTHDEHLTPIKVLGIVVGFFGVIVLFLPDLRSGIQIEFWGELAVVVAAASYGLATVIAHKYLDGVSHVVAATGQLGSAALCMIPLSLLFDGPLSLRPSLPAVGSLLILTLMGTSFAYILYYWLIEHTGATRTALVTYLIPITGIFWGAALLGEVIAWESIAGLLLIIVGIAFVNRTSAPRREQLRPVSAVGK